MQLKRSLKLTLLVSIAALSTLVVGCAPQMTRPDAQMSTAEYEFMLDCMETETNRRTTGAVAGGAGGAAIGAVADQDKRGRGALIGGALGALAGYFGGKMLDRRACEVKWLVLQNDALRGEVSVYKDERRQAILLTGSSDVTFGYNSAEIRPAFTALLDGVGSMLQRDRSLSTHVVGHTDSRGSDSYNLQLSRARASAVANHLQQYSRRVTAEGRGETAPVFAHAQSEAEHAANRRVEIELQL